MNKKTKLNNTSRILATKKMSYLQNAMAVEEFSRLDSVLSRLLIFP